MIWLVIFLIGVGLAVPYWLGIAPPAIAHERRFIGRMVIVGLTAGLVLNTVLTLAWRHTDIDLSPLLVIMNGGAVGALIGLVGASFMRFRRRQTAARDREPDLKL